MQTFFVVDNRPFLLEAINIKEAEKAVGNYRTVLHINNMPKARIVDGNVKFYHNEDKE